jgi:hypothetical protein
MFGCLSNGITDGLIVNMLIKKVLITICMDYHQTMIESEYFDDQNKHARGAQTV